MIQQVQTIKPKEPSVVSPKNDPTTKEQDSKEDAVDRIEERIFLSQLFHTLLLLKGHDDAKEDRREFAQANIEGGICVKERVESESNNKTCGDVVNQRDDAIVVDHSIANRLKSVSHLEE
jgi:hypothetical protein